MASDSLRSGLVLGLTLLTIGAMTAKLLVAERDPDHDHTETSSTVDRVLYYLLTPEQGPHFRLQGTEHRVKLVSHALISDSADNPDQRLTYGISVEIEDSEGAPVWSDMLYVESRRSVGRDEEGSPANAYMLDEQAKLTDDRISYINLPEELPSGARLIIKAHDAPGDVLARAYALREGSLSEQLVRALSLDSSQRAALARTIGISRWEQLDDTERQGLVREHWQRLAALGENGVNYELRAVYYTGWRAPPPEALDDQDAILVTQGRPCVINLLGPTTVQIAASTTTLETRTLNEDRVPEDADATSDSRDPETLQRVVLDIEMAGATGVQAPRLLPLPQGPGDAFLTSLFVPAGAHSLFFSTNAGAANLTLDAPPESHLHRIEEGQGEFFETQVEPELRRQVLRLLGPARPAGTFGVYPEDDLLSRTYRLDFRRLGIRIPEETSLVTVEGVDSEGSQVFLWKLPLEAEPATYEHVEYQDGLTASVDQPVSFRFIIPKMTEQIRVTSSDPVGAQISAYMPSELKYELPYEDLEPELMRWRYAPIVRTPWVSMRFDDRHGAGQRGELARLVAQVRLEAKDAPEPADPSSMRSAIELHPQGSPRRHLLVDRVRSEATRIAWREWKPGSYTALALDREQTLDFGRGPKRRATLQYWLEPSDEASLGDEITLRVGETSYPLPLNASRGTWSLPREINGAQTVSVETGRAKLRVLIDRPEYNRPRLQLHRTRTVYRLGRSALVVSVDKPSWEAVTVNAIVYGHSRAEAPNSTLISVLDRGSPARREGTVINTITQAERTHTLAAASRPTPARFADLAGIGAVYPRTVSITLGDDIPPGAHQVALRVEQGPPLWVRFFVFDQRAPTVEKTTSWSGRSAEPGRQR